MPAPISRFSMFIGLFRYWSYRRRSRPSDQAHVFVVGAPRSGTSLMQVLLARHSNLVAIEAETGFFAPNFVLNRVSRWTGERRELIDQCGADNLVGLCDEFAHALKQSRGLPDSTFVEKTPLHVLQLKFLIDMYPRAKFVNMVRDPRDCFASSIIHPNVRKGAAEFSRYWKKCIERRLAVGEHPRVLDVFYESFVRQPEEQLQQLMAFLDIPYESAQLQPDAGNSDERSQRAEFQRLSQPVTAKSVGKYRSRLTAEQLAIVERVIGDSLELALQPKRFRQRLTQQS